MSRKVLIFSAAAATNARSIEDAIAFTNQRNSDNPHATFSSKALLAEPNVGGCYTKPSSAKLAAAASKAPFTFTPQELAQAQAGPSIDWRKEGAVNEVQQQHPFGTCWAFSMTAVTEAVNVIQGKNPLQKLSEQVILM